MRKLNRGRKFGRTADQRKALFKSLIQNLLIHGKIRTTEAKAKELRPKVEKIITRGKVDSVANRRIVAKLLIPEVVKKLFVEVGPMFKDRKGGYTRITKVGTRTFDAAPMAIIELVK